MDSADRPRGVTAEEWAKHLQEQTKAERRAFNEREEERRAKMARERAEAALGFKLRDPSDAGGYANGQRFRPRHPLERQFVFRLQAAEFVRLDPPHASAPMEEHEAYAENKECDMIFFNGDIKQRLSHASQTSPYDERLLCEVAARVTREFERELQKYLRAYMAETRNGNYGSFADKHRFTGWEDDVYGNASGKAATSEGSGTVPKRIGAGDQPGVEGDGGVRGGSDGPDGQEREES